MRRRQGMRRGERGGTKGRTRNAVRAKAESSGWQRPPASGLFNPADEKDSCGVGFIADIKGRKSHQTVEDGLTILLNLEHRAAVGADPRPGAGAGILTPLAQR